MVTGFSLGTPAGRAIGGDSAFPSPRARPPEVPANDAAPPEAASPLLTAAAPLLVLIETAGVERARYAQALRRFAEDAAALGAPAPSIRFAATVLAAMIGERAGFDFDERLAGAAAGLGRRLETVRRAPEAHRAELEFLYACFALGFDRSYGGGRGAHDGGPLRGELYRSLRRLRGPAEALSPARPPVPAGSPLRPRPARWWAALALVPLLAGGAWMADTLARAGDPPIARMNRMVPAAITLVHRGVPPDGIGPALVTRIAAALAGEIDAHTLAVEVADDGALVIRVFATGMFPLDGDAVSARHRVVIERIAAVLVGEPGRVVVVDHIDDVFAPGDRFATPEALTAARAEAVRRLLEPRLGADRLSASGRGMAEPIASNGDAAGRSLNRRIEIRLYPL